MAATYLGTADYIETILFSNRNCYFKILFRYMSLWFYYKRVFQ